MGCDPVESGGGRPPRWPEHQKLKQWERDHESIGYQDHHTYPRGYGGSNRAESTQSLFETHYDHNGYPRTYYRPSHNRMEVTVDTTEWLYERERNERRERRRK